MAGWTGDQAEVAPAGLDEAATAREDLWSAMHAAERAAERGVLRTGVDAHREAVDGVLRAVEAVERAEGRTAHANNALPALGHGQNMGMPASTPPLELEKTQALTTQAAAEMRQAGDEVPDPLENLPRGEEEEFERLLETYQLAAGALERRAADEPLPSMLSPEAVHALGEEERAQRAEELEHWLTEAESALGTEFQQFDDANLEQARAELDALHQRLDHGEPGLDEAYQDDPPHQDLGSFRPDQHRAAEYAPTPFEGLDEEAQAAQIEHLRAEETEHEQEAQETEFARADAAQEAAELAPGGAFGLDEEFAAAEHAHPASANTSDAELDQLDGDPTAAADAELVAGFPSTDGTAGEAQIVDDLETDLDRDRADTGADLEDDMVHRAGGGEPVDEVEDEPTTAIDVTDQLSAEHDVNEGGVDSQADRLARTRLEPDSEPSYASHTEVSAADHAHEAEMDW